jgi:hypothetical protein
MASNVSVLHKQTSEGGRQTSSTGHVLKGEGAEDEEDTVSHALARQLNQRTSEKGPRTSTILGGNQTFFRDPGSDLINFLHEVCHVSAEHTRQ